jgi:hypothetical protein
MLVHLFRVHAYLTVDLIAVVHEIHNQYHSQSDTLTTGVYGFCSSACPKHPPGQRRQTNQRGHRGQGLCSDLWVFPCARARACVGSDAS